MRGGGARRGAGGADAAPFHGPDGQYSEDVAGDVEIAGVFPVGGDEGGFELVAVEGGTGGTGGTSDGLDEGLALEGDIADRAAIFPGEEAEENGDKDAGDKVAASAERGKCEEAADDDDIERPVPLEGVGAVEVECKEIVVGHGGLRSDLAQGYHHSNSGMCHVKSGERHGSGFTWGLGGGSGNIRVGFKSF